MMPDQKHRLVNIQMLACAVLPIKSVRSEQCWYKAPAAGRQLVEMFQNPRRKKQNALVYAPLWQVQSGVLAVEVHHKVQFCSRTWASSRI